MTTSPDNSSVLNQQNSSTAPITFSHLITLKLDEQNFYLWKQQIEGVIRGYKLQRFLVNPIIPPRFLSEADRDAGNINPAYTTWEQQDSLLFTWLLSSLSESVLPHVMICVHSWQIWEELHNFFDAQNKAQSSQLRSELKTISKGSLSMTDYLKKIKLTVNTLHSIGDPVRFRDHLETILDGLPDEYHAIVAVIQNRSDICTIAEVEAMLLSHDVRLEKSKKKLLADSSTLSVNVAQVQGSTAAPTSSTANQVSFSPQNDQNFNSPQQSGGFGRGQFSGGFRGRGGRRGRGRGGRFGGRSNIQCQICYKFGHDASMCYHRFSDFSPAYAGYYPPPPTFNTWYSQPPRPMNMQYTFPGSTPSNAPRRPTGPTGPSGQAQAYLAAPDSNSTQSWYPDSGATHHVTNDAANMTEHVTLTGSEEILMGNGQGLSITSVGSKSFPSPYHPNTFLHLKNLLHVPSITKNLVSVSKFAKDNAVYFEFHPTFCVVKSQVNSEILLRGTLDKDGLYTFDNISSSFPCTVNTCNIPTPTVFTAVQSALDSQHFNSTSASKDIIPSTYTMWHYRLGHPHHEALRVVLQHCNISVPNKRCIDFCCTACCLGKSHRLPSSTSNTVYTTPLELIFSDLWGPAPIESSCGFKYILTCVDAFSRYTWVYPLKAKSDTFTTFLQFKAMVELQFNTKLKAVQTDWGE